MKTEEICGLCMMIAVVSFLGFVVENLWLGITKGFMDNRNMYLPFLLGYGLAVVAIYLLFGTPGNMVILGKELAIKSLFMERLTYFLVVMLCVSVGEILLGTFVEKTCHFYWWDYSRLPLHITRYTSLPTSTGFTLMIYVFMEHVFLPLFERFQRWDIVFLKRTAGILMAAMVIDFLYSSYLMYKNKKIARRWTVDVTKTKGYRLIHS